MIARGEPDIDLIKLAQQGDTSARNALIERHERFIWLMVRRALGRGKQEHAEEYFASGVMGMIRAIMKWDEDFGATLLTYAGISIKRFVWQQITKDTQISRPAVKPRAHLRKTWMRAAWPAADAGSEAVGLRTHHEHPIEAIARADERAEISRALDVLSPRDRDILIRRMLGGETLAQIGQDHRITKERVRMIQSEAIAKIRKACAGVIS